METKTSAKGMDSMKLIGAAIVVIIVIAAGVLVLTGSKGGSKATTTIAATTTVATTGGSSSSGTSGSSSGSGSPASTGASNTSTSSSSGTLSSTLSGWTGKNLTIAQFSADLGGVSHSVQSQYNVTYDYKTHVSSAAPYAYSENSSGTTMVERYYNDSRITTTSNTAEGAATVIAIYNATAQKDYVCSSSAQSSMQCIATATNVSAQNSSGLGYISSLNSTTKGYFNNIKVSSSSYNGQACTLVSGDLYLSTVVDNSTSSTNGQMSMCLSTSLGVLLTQSMNATTNIKSSSYSSTSNLNYTMDEVSIGKSTTAAITVLPGPVSTV